MTTAFLMPGQGCYRPGILAASSHSPAITEVVRGVDQASAEFGGPAVSELLLSPTAPAGELLAEQNPLALQLAAYATSLGGLIQACERSQTQPGLLVGHSMGEIAALAAAGSVSYHLGARIVGLRTLAIQENYRGTGGMLAVALPEDRAEHLAGLIGDRDLVVAVSNSPTQTVLAGPTASVRAAREVAGAIGVSAKELNSPYPFHSPGLAHAAVALKAALVGVSPHPPRIPLYSPILRDYLSHRTDVVQLLADHLTTRLDFVTAARRLQADGMHTVVEYTPTGLAGLVEKCAAGVSAVHATGPDLTGHPHANAATTQAAPSVLGGVDIGTPRPSAVPSAVAEPAPPHAWTQPAALQPEPLWPAAPRPATDPIGERAVQTNGSPQQVWTQPGTARPDLTPAHQPDGLTSPVPIQSVAEPVVDLRPANEPMPSTTSGPVSETAEGILPELTKLYANTLGYPVEAITADADLEADLGIDSLKRAEMLAIVRTHFELPEVTDDGMFLTQSTLGDLAGLIATTLTSAR